MNTYERNGVRFEYPEGWHVSEQETEDSLTINVESTHASFWTLVIFHDGGDPEDVIEQIVESYRDEYPDLDEYPVFSAGAGIGLQAARELDFVCLDLVTTVSLKAIRTAEQTLLIVLQGPDAELDTLRETLEAITRSLQVEDESPGEEAFGDDGSEDSDMV